MTKANVEKEKEAVLKESVDKPASTSNKPIRLTQEKVIIQKLVNYVGIVNKQKNLKSKIDPTKVFIYTAVLKSSNRAGTINFEIKPEGDKFRYVCKIVIETLNQEETVEFTSNDAAEVIRQLKVTLGGANNDID
jgi:hypothetical protein